MTNVESDIWTTVFKRVRSPLSVAQFYWPDDLPVTHVWDQLVPLPPNTTDMECEKFENRILSL